MFGGLLKRAAGTGKVVPVRATLPAPLATPWGRFPPSCDVPAGELSEASERVLRTTFREGRASPSPCRQRPGTKRQAGPAVTGHLPRARSPRGQLRVGTPRHRHCQPLAPSLPPCPLWPRPRRKGKAPFLTQVRRGCAPALPRVRATRGEQQRRRLGDATHQLSLPDPLPRHEICCPAPSPVVFPEKSLPPCPRLPGPLTSHGVGSPLRAVMKLGAREPHQENPVSAPAEAAAAVALLRRENHTSEAAPRGAAPRAARRRAPSSLAAAPRPPAEPLRGSPGRRVADGEAGEGDGKELR